MQPERASASYVILCFNSGSSSVKFALYRLGADGGRFLLDTATLSIMSHYQDIPAVQRWNAPLVP